MQRCPICSNRWPCSQHSGDDVDRELARNKAAIRELQRDLPVSKRIYP